MLLPAAALAAAGIVFGLLLARTGRHQIAYQPPLPLRAAFYYAWYPENWSRQPWGPTSRYTPSQGFYDSGRRGVVQAQLRAMRYAHIDAGIYSWWGPGTATDRRFPAHLAAARATRLRWALYFEPEGYGDPRVAQIRATLHGIQDRYARDPAYLRVDGRFVVFVYGAQRHETCSIATRWTEANDVDAYLVLKRVPGYRRCAAQPDAWHEYDGAEGTVDLSPDSFTISPGFEPVRLSLPLARPRSPVDWRRRLRAMVASGARFQLVLSFNEWPEATAVESAREWATPSGYGAYLDELHQLPTRGRLAFSEIRRPLQGLVDRETGISR